MGTSKLGNSLKTIVSLGLLTLVSQQARAQTDVPLSGSSGTADPGFAQPAAVSDNLNSFNNATTSGVNGFDNMNGYGNPNGYRNPNVYRDPYQSFPPNGNQALPQQAGRVYGGDYRQPANRQSYLSNSQSPGFTRRYGPGTPFNAMGYSEPRDPYAQFGQTSDPSLQPFTGQFGTYPNHAARWSRRNTAGNPVFANPGYNR